MIPRVRSWGRSPVARLSAASLAGQLLLAVALPFVARLYGPHAVGLYASILTMSQVGSIVATGRVEQILPRLGEPDRGIVLVWAVGLGVCAAGPLGWSIAVSASTGSALIGASIFLVASLALYAICNMLLLAQGEFGQVARLRLSNAAATAGLQVGIGVIAPSASLLVFAYGAGSLIACLHAVSTIRSCLGAKGGRTVSEVNRDEGVLPFIGTVGSSALITSATLGLPVVGLTYIYGENVAASFFLARRVMMVPGQIVSTTLSEISYSLLAKSTLDEVVAHVRRWLKRLVPSSIAIIIFGVALAYPVHWALGPGYVSVGWVLVVLSVGGAAQLLAQSMSSILLVLRLEWLRLAVNGARLMTVALTLLVVWLSGIEYFPAVILMTGATVIGLLALLGVTLIALQRKASVQPDSGSCVLGEGSV